MEKRYNLNNLEALFRQWLLAGNVKTRINANVERKHELTRISVKNYLSDLRHFLGWLIFKLKVKNEKLKIEKGLLLTSFLSQVNRFLIEDYKSYLLTNNIPIKTINRRLSTLRKFCTFCIEQGWMKENPAKHVTNIALRNTESHSESQTSNLLEDFASDLKKEISNSQLVKSYLDDIREFLEYTNLREWERE